MAKQSDTPAKQSDTPKILDEISRSNAAKPKQSDRSSLSAGLLLLLMAGLLGAAAYLAYEQTNLRFRLAELSRENATLVGQLQTQSAQLGVLQERVDQPSPPVAIDDSAFRGAIDQVETSINSEISRLRRQISNLQAELARVGQEPSTDWKLNEAQYLLGIANQKLQLEGDVPGAVALLRQADAALLAADSGTVLAPREAIASHLQALRSLQAVDRDGLYLRIDALAKQAAAVDLPGSMRENFENRGSGSSEPVDVTAAEYDIINAGIEFLSSVFVWRKWENSPEAMVLPGQEAYIKHNLTLMFEQAKLALLMRDRNLYRQALERSRDWLQRYAVTTSAAGAGMLEEINLLAAIDIDPPLPDLGATLELIAGVINAQQQ